MKVTAETSRITVPEFGWQTADPPRSMAYLLPAMKRLLPPLGPQTRVLDVGCGNGFLAGWFAQQGCLVVGIDLSKNGIEHARRTHPAARFEVLGATQDLIHLLEAEQFDIVVSTEVVEHLYAPRDWAAGCFGALRPGGMLICTTPYHGFLKNLFISLKNGWDRHMNPLRDGGHIKFWSRATLTKLLRESRFTNIRFRGAGRAPYLWMSMVMTAERPPA